MDDLLREAYDQHEYTRSIRRDLHRRPELGFQEYRTAGIVAGELRALGIEVTTGVAETGVVGLLEGRQPGPVILLRFDMDALPIQEENETDYISETPGIMHACGHDGHVAVGLTVARLLSRRREQFNGTVKLVFQPGEEGLGGAERMIAAGAMENPRPAHSLAMHFWNEKPLGWLGISPGPLMAGADLLDVRIHGVGGHGAAPHRSVDPVVVGAQIITALQTIVSRNLSPLESGVVTVSRLKAGEAYNVIPQSVDMAGTIRTFEEDVREKVVERIEQITAGIARGMGCEAEVAVRRLTPAVVNDAGIAARFAGLAREMLPTHQVDTAFRTMVSEDMAYFLREAPGCYLMVGSSNPARGLSYGHHHPRFDFDEDALPLGVALMAKAALELLA